MWFSFRLAFQKRMPANNTGGMVLNRKIPASPGGGIPTGAAGNASTEDY